MELDLSAILKERPEALLFLVIGIGYLVGKIKIRGFELSAPGGVLFTALLMGHFGFELPRMIETIGFIFFIYSVGFQSGPRFFSSFKKDGVSYIILAAVIVFSAFGLVNLASYVFDLDLGYAAGILGGAMTSTPTLAAAQDAVNSGMITIQPGGLSMAKINANITVGYAISYVFGLFGLIVFISVLPRIMKIDFPAEAAKLAGEMKISDDSDDDGAEEGGLSRRKRPTVRTYRVANDDIVGKTLGDLKFITATGAVILKIKRGDDIITPEAGTIVEKGDLVAVVGLLDSHQKAQKLAGGSEVSEIKFYDYVIETRQVVVTSNSVIGRTIAEMNIAAKYSCLVDKITRAEQEMPVGPHVKLEKGDNLVITGIRERLDSLIKLLGHAERPIYETDLITFAFGIVCGIIIGTTTIKIGQFSVGIGMAGGLLITGLLIGFLRAKYPTFGRVPVAARFILKEMGILFFLAGVGLRAGQNLEEGLRTVGPQIFVSGIFVTIVPAVIGFIVGRRFLKMNPVILMGAITGAMTSTPSLVAVNKAAKNTTPALGYAGAYAMGNILLTVLGQIIMKM